MRYLTAALLLSLVALIPFKSSGTPVDPQPQQSAQAPSQDRPKVDVVFALDTTGSMGGLLEGAKQKIWSIASNIAKGRPAPILRVGLVAYRDVGDVYVTRVTPLTTDLDEIYTRLRELQPDGGGDTPEHVGRALGEAVSKFAWGDDRKTLKMIFIVGDAPPAQREAQWSYQTWAQRAADRKIIVNTIRCGEDPAAGAAFQTIARLTNGSFNSIDQSGGVVAVAAPYDEELARLNGAIAAKTIYVGREAGRREAEAKKAEVSSLSGAAAADRLGYVVNSKAGGRAVSAAPAAPRDTRDLTESPAEIAKVSDDELSDELRAMTKEQRKAYVEKVAAERKDLEGKALEVAKQREAWLAKNSAEKADSFDAKVMEGVKKNASEYGLRY